MISRRVLFIYCGAGGASALFDPHSLNNDFMQSKVVFAALPKALPVFLVADSTLPAAFLIPLPTPRVALLIFPVVELAAPPTACPVFDKPLRDAFTALPVKSIRVSGSPPFCGGRGCSSAFFSRDMRKWSAVDLNSGGMAGAWNVYVFTGPAQAPALLFWTAQDLWPPSFDVLMIQ